MDKNAAIQYIQDNLSKDKDTQIDSFKIFKVNENLHSIKVIAPKENENINIPYILVVPKTKNIGNKILIESNNLEKNDIFERSNQIGNTIERLLLISANNPNPIIVPIIPTETDEEPYYQQLSKECFELNHNHKYYRIDLQLVKIIQSARSILKQEFGISTEDKVFMHGYSSSGVFAQRFALLHPELIDTLCVGGAIGSIPIPSKKLEYPIGIKDYQELFHKEFDEENYRKIRHRYYVGELEEIALSDNRIDENGKQVPLHDMSYLSRSIPSELGIELRKIFGKEMIPRFKSISELLRNEGFDIQYTIFPGRTHNDKSGKGVNELGDAFTNNAYNECIKNKSKHISNDIEK